MDTNNNSRNDREIPNLPDDPGEKRMPPLRQEKEKKKVATEERPYQPPALAGESQMSG